MSDSFTATLGPKGRIVIPQELRTRRGWTEGSVLQFSDDGQAVSLGTATEALQRFRASVAGVASPVDELLHERRQAARAAD